MIWFSCDLTVQILHWMSDFFTFFLSSSLALRKQLYSRVNIILVSAISLLCTAQPVTLLTLHCLWIWLWCSYCVALQVPSLPLSLFASDTIFTENTTVTFLISSCLPISFYRITMNINYLTYLSIHLQCYSTHTQIFYLHKSTTVESFTSSQLVLLSISKCT